MVILPIKRGESHLSAGRRPKNVTNTKNEMPKTTRAMVARVPILMVVKKMCQPELHALQVPIFESCTVCRIQRLLCLLQPGAVQGSVARANDQLHSGAPDLKSGWLLASLGLSGQKKPNSKWEEKWTREKESSK